MKREEFGRLFPGDEVRLKFGDFPVIITRRNLTVGKRHYDFAGERKDTDKNNYLLFSTNDIEEVLKSGQKQLNDYLRISFWDTLEKLEYPALKELSLNAIESTKVYKEGFYSPGDKTASLSGFARINVLKMTAFDAVRYFHSTEKTAVINFANPLIPGGSVKEGGLSREECMCRSSCLYPCLCREDLQREFYDENRIQTNNWFTDKVLYTSGVTVFKSDSLIPQVMSWKDWIMTDVISAATPCCPQDRYVSKTVLKNIFIPRIRNIFEAAIDNEVTVLIAGAFGCGRGGFDPKIVASAFMYLLREEEYVTKFNHIIFAIASPSHEYSEELNIFSQTFSGDWYHSKVDILTRLELPAGRKDLAYYLPNGRKLDGIILETYVQWRMKNSYFDKRFSIIGDGISTLQGYNPGGAKVFYGLENYNATGVGSVLHTWWGMLADYFGSEILVNSSWSGSMVTKAPDQSLAFPAAYSKTRTGTLHQMRVEPEVILVYVGTNDWLKGVKPEKEKKPGLLGRLFGSSANQKPDYSVFEEAYRKMLSRLRKNYPEAEIWCCTLTSSYMSQNPSFVFPLSYGGENIEVYNNCIRWSASEYRCRIIDFYRFGIPYDSVDGTRPNLYGMRALAYMAILSMVDAQGKTFLKQ